MTLNSKTCGVLDSMRKLAYSENAPTRCVVGDIYQVQPAFVELITSRVEEVIPFLMTNQPYTAEQLFGSDLMAALNSGEARMAALAVADMVNRREVVFTAAGCDADGAATYLRLDY